MSAPFPTDAERDVFIDAIEYQPVDAGVSVGIGRDDAEGWADDVLAALAPLVGAREAAAEQRGSVAALREARDAWQTGEWSALTIPARKGGPSGVIGAAQAVTRWLGERADAGEGRDDD